MAAIYWNYWKQKAQPPCWWGDCPYCQQKATVRAIKIQQLTVGMLASDSASSSVNCTPKTHVLPRKITLHFYLQLLNSFKGSKVTQCLLWAECLQLTHLCICKELLCTGTHSVMFRMKKASGFHREEQVIVLNNGTHPSRGVHAYTSGVNSDQSQDHRIKGVEGTSGDTPIQQLKATPYDRCVQESLNISREGNPTTSLGRLCRGSVTFQ